MEPISLNKLVYHEVGLHDWTNINIWQAHAYIMLWDGTTIISISSLADLITSIMNGASGTRRCLSSQLCWLYLQVVQMSLSKRRQFPLNTSILIDYLIWDPSPFIPPPIRRDAILEDTISFILCIKLYTDNINSCLKSTISLNAFEGKMACDACSYLMPKIIK